MRERIFGVCVAVLVSGTVTLLPAIASAAPVLTESGSKLAVGSKITATNDGTAIFIAGELKAECASFWTTSTLVTNDSTKGIKSTVENGGTSNCTSTFGAIDLTFPGATNEGGTKHMCIQSGVGDTGTLFGRGCQEEGNGEMTIVANITSGGFKCSYKREAVISGSFTTNSTPATLKLEGEPVFAREGTSILCPASVKIVQLSFNIYTDNAEETPLSVS